MISHNPSASYPKQKERESAMLDENYLPLDEKTIPRINRVFLRRSDCAITFAVQEPGDRVLAVNVSKAQASDIDDRKLLPNEEHTLLFCAELITAMDGVDPTRGMDCNQTCAWARNRMVELGIPGRSGTLPSELSIPPHLGDLFKLLELFTGKSFARYELKPQDNDPLFIAE